MSEVVGFPWDKVSAARAYLLTLKPWLSALVGALIIVPVDRPSPTGHGWITAPQADERGRVYLDRSYCMEVPLEVLAATIEYESALIARDLVARMSWIEEPQWHTVAIPAIQAEIAGSIDREATVMDALYIDARVSQSVLFTLADMERWEVQGPPTLRGTGVVHPRDLMLPEGLSAETYAHTLRLAISSADLPGLSGASSSDGDGRGTKGSGKGGTDASSGDSVKGGDTSDDGTAADQGADSSEGDGGAGGEPSADDDLAHGGDGHGGDEADLGDEAQGDAAADDEAQRDSALARARELVEQMNSRTNTTWRKQVDASALVKTIGAANIEMSRRHATSSADAAAWQMSIPHPDDPFALDLTTDDPDVEALTPSELSTAVVEMARAVTETRAIAGVGPGMLSWEAAREILERRDVAWERHLARVLTSSLTSEQVKGASDLTYSVPNPNQPRLGVRMLGLNSYAPKVTVIQDVSGSMMRHLQTSMEAVNSLMRKTLARLQAETEWLTFDTTVKDVGKGRALKAKDTRSWQGGGGTDLGPVIAYLMGDRTAPKVEWSGRKLAVPDLLVVSTDAMFEWPQHRPSRQHRLLVILYHPNHLSYVPEWVDREREIVIIP